MAQAGFRVSAAQINDSLRSARSEDRNRLIALPKPPLCPPPLGRSGPWWRALSQGTSALREDCCAVRQSFRCQRPAQRSKTRDSWSKACKRLSQQRAAAQTGEQPSATPVVTRRKSGFAYAGFGPAGRTRMAQRFNAGMSGGEGFKSRHGRQNAVSAAKLSVVPGGTGVPPRGSHPALKRWAILVRPAGLKRNVQTAMRRGPGLSLRRTPGFRTIPRRRCFPRGRGKQRPGLARSPCHFGVRVLPRGVRSHSVSVSQAATGKWSLGVWPLRAKVTTSALSTATEPRARIQSIRRPSSTGFL